MSKNCSILLTMYTDLFFKLVNFIFNSSCLFGSSCIKYDLKNQLFYCTKSSKKRLFIWILIFVDIVTFWVYRTTELFFYHGGNANEYFHICYAFTFIATMETGSLCFILWKHDDFTCAMNQVTRYLITFQRKF